MRVMTGIITLAALTGSGAALAQAAVKTADYAFDYGYPAAAARIVPLRTWLDADRATLRAKIARDAAKARADARAGKFDFKPYEVTKTWKTVTDTPRFLSLSGEQWSYTGGAHGNGGAIAMLWDKTAKQRLPTKSLFVSPDAIQMALGPSWCTWLKAERARKMGGAAPSDDIFSKCPAVTELTLLLGSTDRTKFDRIGLIADPYVAGSYAEGSYEMTVPVTPAVLRAVKPAYRSAFALR